MRYPIEKNFIGSQIFGKVWFINSVFNLEFGQF